MPATLMIIDDDNDDREIFCEAARSADRSVHCIQCSGGDEAFDRLLKKSARPDIIFLDMNMPKINGKQCLVKMQGYADLREIPVIMYTTSNRIEDVEETKRLGAVAFLTKPTSMEDLVRAIRLALKQQWGKIQPASVQKLYKK